MKRKKKRDGKKKKNIRVGVDPPIPLDEKHGDKCQLDQVVDFGTDLACSVRPAKGWLRDLMISILDRHLILDSNRLIIGCCAISSVLLFVHSLSSHPPTISFLFFFFFDVCFFSPFLFFS